MELKGAEIFSEGAWNGQTFSEADIDGIIASFEALNLSGRVPLKFGHDNEHDGWPALGWIQRVYRRGQKLMADFDGIPKAVYEAIKTGLYKFCSVELLKDVKAGNRVIPFVLDACALLGADAPAVGTLQDLQALTMRRRPQLQYAARLSFSRDGESELEVLRAENKRLHAQLLAQAIDSDVRSGRVLPAERARFSRRFGDSATTADWADWVKDVPRPATINQPRSPSGPVSADANYQSDLPPDQEVANLVRAEVEKSGNTLTFSAATTLVLRANPELADRYRYQPGTK